MQTSSNERDQRRDEVFLAAVEQEASRRDAFLVEQCGGDAELLEEVRSLLTYDAKRNDEGLRLESTPSLPPSIGPYFLIRTLGEGGMGSVHLVEQCHPVQRRLALKVIKLGMDTREVLARFQAERQALAWMNHPCIARVIDAGSTETGRPYFVMEYVDGVPITEYCDRRQWSIEERIALFLAVCAGVQHAHQKGIIHRDLKPSNILVAEADGIAAPKIIDFGVAKATGAATTEGTQQTLEGQVLGTPEYMSPEQASGTGPLDTRIDVYALGVILFELLAGTRPHETQSKIEQRRELLRRVMTEEVPAPSSCVANRNDVARDRGMDPAALGKRLRGDLDAIVIKALERDPNRRYASVQDLAADLERHRRHEPITAAALTTSYVLRKFIRKHYGKVLAAAMILAALFVGLITTSWQYLRARDFARTAEQNLEQVRRLADVKIVRDLLEEARTDLWPPVPSRIGAFHAWLERADEVASRIPAHERRHLELQMLLQNSSREDLAWEHSVLKDLLEQWALLIHPDPWNGKQSVEERLSKARAIEDLEVSPETPIDLIPLGRNEATGLWEFWHVNTGTRPSFQEENGCTALVPENGLVLVLLPGGEFEMGAVWKRNPAVQGLFAAAVEFPVHRVQLDPFFLSKFELTQSQWERWTGTNPSTFAARHEGEMKSRVHLLGTSPVEQISWTDAELVLRQMGLQLPTEAQWEYGCRGGAETRYFFGNDDQDVATFANVADEGSKSSFRPDVRVVRGVDDGNVLHAPVGSFRPNDFGLYDVHGNVSEWCLDWFGPYDLPVREGTGERLVETNNNNRIVRGGHYERPADEGTCTIRASGMPDQRLRWIGVRPARAVRGALSWYSRPPPRCSQRRVAKTFTQTLN